MKNAYKSLNNKQTVALQAILEGGGVPEAAEAAGVKRGTVYTWLNQPNFIMAMNTAKAEALEGLTLSLQALGKKAIQTLDAAMDDPHAGHSVKVRAAEIVITKLMAMRDLIEFENRLIALEEAQANPAARDIFEVKPVNYRTAIKNLDPNGGQETQADNVYQ